MIKSDNSIKKYKHLTLDDRMHIHLGLNEGKSANAIALEINKSISTITREIKNHITSQRTTKNDCLSKGLCNCRNVCNKTPACRGICSKCKVPCKKYCSDERLVFMQHHRTYNKDIDNIII